MRSRLRTRSLTISLGIAVALGIVAGLTATAAPAGAIPATVDLSTRTGVGEALLLVVYDQYPTETDALDAVAELSFGDMQGFYVDAAKNYSVIGVYDQISPDYQVVDCHTLPQAVPNCTDQPMRAELPVSLEYVPVEQAGAKFEAADRAPCGQTGQRPCVAARLRGLLPSPGYQFDPKAYLVLTAFRTKTGAQEFAELARNRGFAAVTVRARKTDGPYIGLGQEANPDGVSGPLIDPLPIPDAYQL